MKFCSHCGGKLITTTPSGDDRERQVCTACDVIHYQNPRIITGCIPVHEDSILLCRRSIEPRRGFWTLPAGFLERGESIAEGALRESFEEARANIILDELYAIYDITHISQVYMFYRGTLADLNFQPGPESEEAVLFKETTIPWHELAFPVIEVVLRHFFEDRRKGLFTLKTAILCKDPRTGKFRQQPSLP